MTNLKSLRAIRAWNPIEALRGKPEIFLNQLVGDLPYYSFDVSFSIDLVRYSKNAQTNTN